MKSPISKPITLKNSVKRVDFINDFSISKSITFNVDSTGAVTDTPVLLADIYIQVTDWQDHGINTILSNEFTLSLITSDQGTVLVT